MPWLLSKPHYLIHIWQLYINKQLERLLIIIIIITSKYGLHIRGMLPSKVSQNQFETQLVFASLDSNIF